MKVALEKGDIVMVRHCIYCFLVKNKTIKEIEWLSYLKLLSYGMLDLKQTLLEHSNSARNYVINGHYELDINFKQEVNHV